MDQRQKKSIALAAEVLANARSVAVLTGAGVSAESGIATFRDAQTGMWSRFDPQQLASQQGFADDPGAVWQWYIHRLARVEEAEPNPGHHALAELERMVADFTLITQNVDDLHERAGSRKVLHLHGHIGRFHCNVCSASYSLRPEDRPSPLPPSCIHCTGYVRPSVVWFGEMMPEEELSQAWRASEHCDVFLVIGTSGVVYPAAQLPATARRHGARVIEINREPSALAGYIEVMLLGPSGELLPRLLDEVRARRG